MTFSKLNVYPFIHIDTRLNQYILHNTYVQQSCFLRNNSLFIKKIAAAIPICIVLGMFTQRIVGKYRKKYLTSRYLKSRMINGLKIYFLFYTHSGTFKLQIKLLPDLNTFCLRLTRLHHPIT